MNQKFLDMCGAADALIFPGNREIYIINVLSHKVIRIIKQGSTTRYYIDVLTATENKDSKEWTVSLTDDAHLIAHQVPYRIKFIKFVGL